MSSAVAAAGSISSETLRATMTYDPVLGGTGATAARRDAPERNPTWGVTAGDWIIAPANTFHLFQVHGDRPAIRIATTYTGEYHRHERDDAPPAPPGAAG